TAGGRAAELYGAALFCVLRIVLSLPDEGCIGYRGWRAGASRAGAGAAGAGGADRLSWCTSRSWRHCISDAVYADWDAGDSHSAGVCRRCVAGAWAGGRVARHVRRPVDTINPHDEEISHGT